MHNEKPNVCVCTDDFWHFFQEKKNTSFVNSSLITMLQRVFFSFYLNFDWKCCSHVVNFCTYCHNADTMQCGTGVGAGGQMCQIKSFAGINNFHRFLSTLLPQRASSVWWRSLLWSSIFNNRCCFPFVFPFSVILSILLWKQQNNPQIRSSNHQL